MISILFDGYAEGVENTVPLGYSENHLGEPLDILRVHDARNVNKSQLFQCVFVEIDLRIVAFGVEDFPCSKQQVLIVFEFVDLVGKLCEALAHLFDTIKSILNLLFNFVQEGERVHFVLFQICIKIGLHSRWFSKMNYTLGISGNLISSL